MSVCRIIVIVFGIAYLGALALLAIGTFGLFGQETDPLAGVFLMPLGLPWSLFTGSFPDAAGLWLAVLAPGLNLMIIHAVCRAVRRPANSEVTHG